MHYEEGLACFTLGTNLPFGAPEQTSSFMKAKEAFACGGLENWVETVQKVLSS
jgi:hypothetical protein